jgi:hypothetical protein
MKEEDTDHQSSCSAEGRSSTGAGEEFNPSESPDDNSPAEPSHKRAVPIGRPVSEEAYRKMKERATKDKPPSGGHTQEDPSHRKHDG